MRERVDDIMGYPAERVDGAVVVHACDVSPRERGAVIREARRRWGARGIVLVAPVAFDVVTLLTSVEITATVGPDLVDHLDDIAREMALTWPGRTCRVEVEEAPDA